MGLSYTDAVRLLGGPDDRVVSALDRLTGGVLLAATAGGSALALSLFDAKSELARLGGELVAGLRDRMSGLGRLGRTERLAAAHSVLVLSAFFEAVAAADLPMRVQLTGAEQVGLVADEITPVSRLRRLEHVLLWTSAPMPAPQFPYEETLEAIRGFYAHLGEELTAFLTGLAEWDALDETKQGQLAETLRTRVPQRAVVGYEELFRRMAGEFPEVAFWANLTDHRATRDQLRSGLADLERILRELLPDPGALDERRSALNRAYRAVVARPVLTASDLPVGLRFPSLGAAYVNPAYRVATAGAGEPMSEESWWAERPVHDDLEGFLLGHLTAPQAGEAPLIVLGQPGSGKSVLTQMLAARLPSDQFLVVRVPLREVPVDVDLQTQIEAAVRTATGETVTWPVLARSAPETLRVVLLDGFDELLQATEVAHTDYLNRVEAFQRREAEQGRPVAVLVTSRTAVADRVRPVPGMLVLRLEPFTEPQIAQWLTAWNEANADSLANRQLSPLTTTTLLAYGELASQPLLLLLLALYDANSNALQRENADLNQAELYERLLGRFVEREVAKAAPGLPERDLVREMERELRQLSVAAFAMFNRDRQWATETELDADLAALLGPRTQADKTDLRAKLSAAQIVLGRFFFMHEARATRHEEQLHTYEFLHATFGEYLVARMVVRELEELVAAAEFAAARDRPAPADDTFLHAVLSQTPLTMRNTVMVFLADRLESVLQGREPILRTVLLSLFREAMEPRRDNRYESYAPGRAGVPARHAAYAANLLFLLVLVGGEVTSTELFPASTDPVVDWRAFALLLRSQLPVEGWGAFVYAIAAERRWADGRRELAFRINRDESPPLGPVDLYWTAGYQPGHPYRVTGEGDWSGWTTQSSRELRRQAHLICDPDDDVFNQASEPLEAEFPQTLTTVYDFGGQNRPSTAANALIELWLVASRECDMEDLASAHQTCLNWVVDGFAPGDGETLRRFREIYLRQLAGDWHRLPAHWVVRTTERIRNAAIGSTEHHNDQAELLTMALSLLPRDLPDSQSERW
ncbi:NACHT domain-containing protein [Cryptosporangium minutisporangium]|uniref:NACHT N-terminal Helical domain-containing protein n=1 Tax=Cryptosporangium minutisporangium TaxID=113569 RepID=A0ABP6TB71_9ACTN